MINTKEPSSFSTASCQECDEVILNDSGERLWNHTLKDYQLLCQECTTRSIANFAKKFQTQENFG